MNPANLVLMRGELGGVPEPEPPVTVTWNPADKNGGITLSGSDLVATNVSGAFAYANARATLGRIATDPGGFYFELAMTDFSASAFIAQGVATAAQGLSSSIGASAESWGYVQNTGEKLHDSLSLGYGATYGNGDIVGFLLKNGKLYFRKNGVWQGGADVDAETGAAFSGLTGTLYPVAATFRGVAPVHVITGRFKASDFSGSIPAGAAAWES